MFDPIAREGLGLVCIFAPKFHGEKTLRSMGSGKMREAGVCGKKDRAE